MKKTKIFAALLSAAAIAASTVLGASAAHYRGDVNRDDNVTAQDVVTVQKYITRKGTLDKQHEIYADMNDDNKINVIDLVLLKRTALGYTPKEEVPALTTPAVTTAVTTTTTVTVTSVSSTTPEITTTASQTTPVVTTSEVTSEVTTEVSTTSAVTSEVTTEVSTVSEVTSEVTTEVSTVSEVTSEVTTEVSTVSEVTSEVTTEVSTVSEVTSEVTSEVLTTPAETTIVTSDEPQSTTTKISIKEGGGTVVIPLDKDRNLDYIDMTIDPSEAFTLQIATYGWDSSCSVIVQNGALVLDVKKGNIDDVIIDGKNVRIKFKDGVKDESINITCYWGEADITINKIAYVGDEDTPVVTTVASSVTTPSSTTTSVSAVTTVSDVTTTSAVTSVTTSVPGETVTGIAGTDVNRALLGFAYNDSKGYHAINGDVSYVGLEDKVIMPEIKGSGTYTAVFSFDEPVNIFNNWIELKLFGANGTNIGTHEYPNLSISIDSFKIDGVDTTIPLSDAEIFLEAWSPARVNLIPLFVSFDVNNKIEVTFTITGME